MYQETAAPEPEPRGDRKTQPNRKPSQRHARHGRKTTTTMHPNRCEKGRILKPNVIPASRQPSFTMPVNFKPSRLQNSASPGGGASQFHSRGRVPSTPSQFQALPEHLKLERVFKQVAAEQQSESLFTSSFFIFDAYTPAGVGSKKTKIDKK